MPDDKKEASRYEMNFLPPLTMVLTFFDKTLRVSTPKEDTADDEKEVVEKSVEKLIEKLSEKEKE
ncbi:MAG TPA: hypothetical protein DCX53_02035 [Anaerolineae bacterium]|nr:hypothetical protein [Anaerolineae bacterium]